MDLSEKNFEAQIEHVLRNVNGYHSRTSSDYDAALCLIPDDVIDFVIATQPESWDKLTKVYGANTRAKFLNRLTDAIERYGTLDVLRKGIKDAGIRFWLVFFRPSSSRNTDTQRRYAANRFSLVRQLFFSQKDRKSLDLTLFLNGLPIFTAELKNHFTGQTVQHAMRQYRKDRSPKEPLFAFGRCLAHFAVDPDLVYVTSHLRGDKTHFLPFNKGRSGGAGNPPVWDNFATHYLWEDLWTKDSVLNLVERFIHVVEVEDDKGRKTGEKRLLIPRYHQLDAVRRLVEDARVSGPGRRYLIQHSAGSGKSNSIAWLAHQLATLHDAGDQRVFDSIIVITDRRILDRQLQTTMLQFEPVRGTVENINTTSRQLKEALESGKHIIVTTLQKFPVIVKEIGTLAGQRFAVIIDEAHSSQGGESVKDLKTVLRVDSLEDAEAEDTSAAPDFEDLLVEQATSRQFPTNVSIFAFTATPKAKTLELFGRQRPDGQFAPFSLYSMRQAIEEGFILDVLQNYVTYRAYWKLLKTIEDDPKYESNKAKALLRRFVELHPHAINEKVGIIADHFHNQTAHQINGKAKAMIVTRSRLHAVRYFLALRRHLEALGSPYKALVAFSGSVNDSGSVVTEAGLNGIPETQTAATFNHDEYRFLVVAEKFQTGFDQPLLHTMYVDKILTGVHAVQTLSRLNRTHPGKDSTLVLDFANDADSIQKAFAPYYEQTLLSESTDHNLLYDRERELQDFHLYTPDDVQAFARLFLTEGTTQEKLHAPLDPVVERYNELSEEAQSDFRSKLTDYLRQYAFLSQIIPFTDTDLEALYIFARLLRRKLPVTREELPTEVLQAIDIDSFRIRETSKGKITPEGGTSVLDPMAGALVSGKPEDPPEALSQIIQQLNDRFGIELTEADGITLGFVGHKIAHNQAIRDSLEVNPVDKARLTFDIAAEDLFQSMFESNYRLYRQISDNKAFKATLLDYLFQNYLDQRASGSLPAR